MGVYVCTCVCTCALRAASTCPGPQLAWARPGHDPDPALLSWSSLLPEEMDRSDGC